MPHTTLTIHICRLPDASFIADAELTSTATAASAQLATNAPVRFAFTELLARHNDPAAYGVLLSAQVFADQTLRDAWLTARARAVGEALQLRLRLDARADELHALRWETLCDPASGQPIALHERVRLVRNLDTANMTPVIVPPRPALRALVIVANPSGLTTFNLAPVDVKGEIARARAALGDIRPTVLGDHVSATGRATLAHIATALRDEPTIVLLVAHGSIVNGVPFLWLEQADGTADRIPIAAFTNAVERLTVRPLLFVLASCTSAGTGYDETLSALGPQLASIGVPAVLGFQGEVAQETISTLLPKLLTELRRDGQIDRAIAAARADLGAARPWWQAVLWLRTDGRLWIEDVDPPFIPIPGLYPPCPQRVGHATIAAELAARLEAAATRRAASVVLLDSPPGYGKHALVKELAAVCTKRGGLVLGVDFTVSPDSAGAEPPVTLVVPAAFRQQTANDYPLGASLGPHWCHLAAQAKLALQRSLAPGRIGEDKPQTLFRELLRPVAYNRLVVLLFEHWERAGTGWDTLLIELLQNVSDPMRLVVVLTRDQAGDAPIQNITTLDTAIAAKTVTQHQLRRVSAADLAAAMGPAHRDLSTRLYEMSAGHPALAMSFWAQWRAVEAVVQDAQGVWQPAATENLWVTGKVRDFATNLLEHCLGQHPPLPVATVRHILAVAALEGPTFTAQAVAEAVGVDLAAFLDLCDDYLWNENPEAGVLLDAGLVKQPAYTGQDDLIRYQFSLPYLHLVFAWALPEAELPALNLALAVVLERHYQPEPERVAGVLATLFARGGEPARAESYRARRERDLRGHVNEAMLRWAITTLTEQGLTETWQMYEARMDLINWLYDHGRYAEAVPDARAALAFAENFKDQERIAQALNQLGRLLRAVGEYTVAWPVFRQGLAIMEKVFGPMHPNTATSLSNLAGLLRAMGYYTDAQPLYERALEICKKVFGRMHPTTATNLDNLGVLHSTLGNYTTARSCCKQALEIFEKTLGPMHPDTVTSLNNLAGLLYAMGDYTAARPLIEHALAIMEKVFGPMHPNTATSLDNLSTLFQSMGDYTAARPLLERALCIYEKTLGPMHPDTATSLNNLAEFLRTMGDYAAARPLHERALDICEQTLGPMHPDTAFSLNNLAMLLNAMGDTAAARPLLERALTINEQALGPVHPDTQGVQRNLATLNATQHDNG